MDFHHLLLAAAAVVAGAMNSVAGGGTLLTFPALLATGQLSTVANATNTVALWPGSVSSCWGYRNEVGANRHLLAPLIVLGLIGGVLGSVLLLVTPTQLFDRVVPYLVLTATLLFVSQERISRWLRSRSGEAETLPADARPVKLTPLTMLLILGISVYGGYFGAGIGIVTLAAFGLMGMRDIHQMNGIKNIYVLFTNGIAAAIFINRGLVDWRIAILMAVGAIVGGYSGAGIARRIGQKNVRRLVIAIGTILTLSLFWRHYAAG